MGLLARFLIFVAVTVVGICFMKFRERLVRIFGKNYLAERYLGNGGSYAFWQILGILFIIGGLIYLVG